MKEITEQIQTLKKKLEKKIIQPEPHRDSSQTFSEKYKHIGIGKRFYNKTIESFNIDCKEKQKAVYLCLQFLENYFRGLGPGILFMGRPGTGKTHLSCAICKKILQRNLDAKIKIINITTILDIIKATYSGRNDSSEGEIIKKLSKLDLLVIDDIGKEYCKVDNMGNSWVNEKLYKIINARYEEEKSIILTTNFNMNELEKRIDAAIISRIVEMSTGITCNWQDYRRKK